MFCLAVIQSCLLPAKTHTTSHISVFLLQRVQFYDKTIFPEIIPDICSWVTFRSSYRTCILLLQLVLWQLKEGSSTNHSEEVWDFLLSCYPVVATLHSSLLPVCASSLRFAPIPVFHLQPFTQLLSSIHSTAWCKSLRSLMGMLTGMLDNSPSDPRRRKGVCEDVRKAGPAL